MFAAKNELLTRPSGGYQISRSLRFRSSASAYLSRTTSTPTDGKKGTLSVWFKASVGLPSQLAYIYGGNTNLSAVFIDNGNGTTYGAYKLIYRYFTAGNAASYYCASNLVIRDPSAWYHLVIVQDTSAATSNRVKGWLNGTLITWGTYNDPPLNDTGGGLNQASAAMNIGTYDRTSANYFYDGYLAEVNFIDGQALTPSSFGAYDTTTGVWGPKKYTGTYGTNGFYLNFSDNSGATSTTIGKDSSGNSNNWTPNNISVTSGTTYDSMIDVPTSYSDGTAYGRGNYATLNPLDVNSTYFVNATFSNANLSISATSSGQYYVHPTISNNTGKFYQEFTVTSLGAGGALTNSIVVSAPGNFGAVYCAYDKSGQKYISGAWTTGWTAWSTNDVIGIAVDYDAGSATYYLNGTLQGTLTFGSQGSAPLCVANNAQAGSGGTASVSFNAGQRPFSISSIPSGYSALNTQNLPTPTIKNGAQYMDATLYNGQGSSTSVTNAAGFAPDFVWIKSRSGTWSHSLFDKLRGVQNALFTNATNAESTRQLTAFNANGFTYAGTDADTGTSGYTYVAWQWKAGGTGVSNTSGSITSTVSANVSAGFSVVTYTGNGTSGATVGHGLGVTPSMIIVKRRDASAAWDVYHSSIGATGRLYLNTTDSTNTSSAPWNNAAPDNSKFTVGNATDTNNNGSTIVAYCFANVSGYSSTFSYTGNGSSDGPMVFLNFRPRWILIKSSSAAEQWDIHDTSRDTYNAAQYWLAPNASSAEGTINPTLDILSNGFKIRYNSGPWNTSGATYVGFAIAENPFAYARAR